MDNIETGHKIKMRLEQNNLTQRWMLAQLRGKDIFIDAATLSTIYSGARKGPQAEEVIKNSLELLDDYETMWRNRERCDSSDA